MHRTFVRYVLLICSLLVTACGVDAANSVAPQGESQGQGQANGDGDDADGSSAADDVNASDGNATNEVADDLKVQAAYLARVYEINADLVDVSGSLTIDGGIRPLADAWSAAKAEFDALAAPPTTQELHDGWVQLATSMATASASFAEVSETGTEPQINTAAKEFVGTSAEVGSASLRLDVLASQLSVQVYRASGSPADLYLADVMALTADSAPASARLFEIMGQLATDPASLDEMSSIFDQIAALSDDYAQLEPPAALVGLHNERLRLLDELAWVGESLQRSADADATADFDLSLRLEAFSADAQQWNIAFSRAAAAALRSIAES